MTPHVSVDIRRRLGNLPSGPREVSAVETEKMGSIRLDPAFRLTYRRK
jgi:hypothetical protein